jgi:hypothetical protein
VIIDLLVYALIIFLCPPLHELLPGVKFGTIGIKREIGKFRENQSPFID